jgi:hypothetical protein
MSIEHPEILLKRLKLGREEYCQRLLTMLLLGDAYPRWNTRSPLSAEGRAFLAALDRLSFGAGADLTEAVFVDEFDLPARAKDPCGAAPDYAVLTTERLWLVELKTERSSHRSDQVQTYVELARHHHPELRVDLTYLTGPGFDAPYDPPAGSRYAHVRWSEALPLLGEAWPDPTEEQRLVIETLHDVLGALSTPWREWRAKRLSIPVEPEWDERDPEQEALVLARLTAEDRAPRALDFEATDLEQLKELRVDVTELIKQDRSSALSHVRPWIWNAASTDGKPLTEAGATVGFELRLSWYKSPKRPTAGTA